MKKFNALRIEVLPLDDPAAAGRWESLLEASPQRSPYASHRYAAHLPGLPGVSAEYFFAVGPEGDEAGVLVFRRRRGPLREVLIPPFTQFTPLLFRHPPREADVHQHRSPFDALLEGLEERFDVLSLHLDPSTVDVRPARWRSWRTTPLYTYRQRLGGADALLAAWSASARRAFRQHREAYRIDEGPRGAADAARLCAESYGRSGRPSPLSPERLEAWISALNREGLARVFSATPAESGTATAAVAFLHDGRTAYYWAAGSEPGPSMTVLLGTALPLLNRDGIAWFDWVGANTPSIAEFKRRFGPALTPYYRIEKIRPASLRLLRAWRDG